MKRLLILLAMLAASGAAHAQSNPNFITGAKLPAASLNAAFITKMDANFGTSTSATINTPTINNGILNNVSLNNGNLLGTLTGGTLSGTTLVNATFVGSTGRPNQITVTCGTSSTLLLGALQATSFITVKLPAAATGGPVWFDYSGSNAVAAPPSMDIAAGQEIVWSTSNGFLPTWAINCLATSSPIAVTLLYK